MKILYTIQSGIILFLVLLILAFFITIMTITWINKIVPFLEEREYIKMEMQHSFDEGEYHYWKRELKQLYLQAIPLIGRFFDK